MTSERSAILRNAAGALLDAIRCARWTEDALDKVDTSLACEVATAVMSLEALHGKVDDAAKDANFAEL